MREFSGFQIARWAKAPRSKSRVQLAVGADQNVLVEGGGDAGRIVIGGDQRADVLHQIDADRAAGPASPRMARADLRKPTASSSSRLPMVEPGKKPSIGRSRTLCGKFNRAHEIGGDGRDRHIGIILLQFARRFRDRVAADVDGDVGGDGRKRGQAGCAPWRRRRSRIRPARCRARRWARVRASAGAAMPSSVRVW